MGCEIQFTFVMSSDCEMFNVTAASDIAYISGVLAKYAAGPMPGRSIDISLQAGEQVEITPHCVTLGALGSQAIIAKKGQATGGSDTTLDDAGANWPENFFSGMAFSYAAYVVIFAGSGAGKVALITGNTATQLSFASLGVSLDATSQYAIVPLWATAPNSDPVPITFTAWETGTYTLEIAAREGFTQQYTPVSDSVVTNPYGRATYCINRPTLTGKAIPIQVTKDAVYDSTRNCFWVMDATAAANYLCQVSTAGVLLSRTLMTAFYFTIGYDPVTDRLIRPRFNAIDLVNPDTLAVTGTIVANANTTNHGTVVRHPGNGYFYLSSGIVIDPVTVALIATVPAISNIAMAFYCPVDGFIWYAQNNKISVVDPASHTVVHTISQLGFWGEQMAYCPATGKVYHNTSAYPATIAVIDPVTYTVSHLFTLDNATDVAHLLYRPQDGMLYTVSVSYSGEYCYFFQIDPATEAVTKRLICPTDPFPILSSSGSFGLLCDSYNRCGASFATHTP